MPILKPLGLKIVMEPGRFLVGNAGILVTRVQYVKDGPSKKFVIVDAAMNDLIRPPLYQAHHEVIARARNDGTVSSATSWARSASPAISSRSTATCPPSRQGDLLAVMSAGAYAMTMASNYNSRGRAGRSDGVRRPRRTRPQARDD